MLTLRAADLEAIYQQAKAEYPAECCGILTMAAGGGVSTAHRCKNIQDELHAKDPEQYPRDSRIAYFIEPGELFRIVRGAEKEGGAVSGFYHSHIDCEAYFSAEDKERAMAWDEPAYPAAIYLVVSVYGDDPRGSKAFAWDAAQTDFVEVEIAVQD
ncbi:uncharacterized protein METZ01_LOCUS481327 [marine metagenome]|uniref:JAB domain-containing protein n=1 Tax=marine metagenome TaxID=408172 RepID=A0A383C8U0_9ZZZZ